MDTSCFHDEKTTTSLLDKLFEASPCGASLDGGQKVAKDDADRRAPTGIPLETPGRDFSCRKTGIFGRSRAHLLVGGVRSNDDSNNYNHQHTTSIDIDIDNEIETDNVDPWQSQKQTSDIHYNGRLRAMLLLAATNDEISLDGMYTIFRHHPIGLQKNIDIDNEIETDNDDPWQSQKQTSDINYNGRLRAMLLSAATNDEISLDGMYTIFRHHPIGLQKNIDIDNEIETDNDDPWQSQKQTSATNYNGRLRAMLLSAAINDEISLDGMYIIFRHHPIGLIYGCSND